MKNPALARLSVFFILGSGCSLCGCKDGEKSSAASVSPETAVSQDTAISPPAAALPARAAADTGALDSDLAAKMTFAGPEEIEKLLQQGANPGAKDRYGLPVLFTAAKRGEAGIVDLLIKAGARVNDSVGTSYNDDGAGYSGTTDGTPVGYAAGAGKIAALETLRNAGADLNGAGPGGTTPLMQAAESGQPEAVTWLLRNGSAAGREKAVEISQRFTGSENHKKIYKALKGEAQ